MKKSNYYDMIVQFLVTDISKGYDGDYDSDGQTTTFPDTNDSGNWNKYSNYSFCQNVNLTTS